MISICNRFTIESRFDFLENYCIVTDNLCNVIYLDLRDDYRLSDKCRSNIYKRNFLAVKLELNYKRNLRSPHFAILIL